MRMSPCDLFEYARGLFQLPIQYRRHVYVCFLSVSREGKELVCVGTGAQRCSTGAADIHSQRKPAHDVHRKCRAQQSSRQGTRGCGRLSDDEAMNDGGAEQEARVGAAAGEPGPGGRLAGGDEEMKEADEGLAEAPKRLCPKGTGVSGLGSNPGGSGGVSRLLLFRVSVDKQGDRASGILECVASLALDGVCRAICQHQGYIVASCGQRVSIFDIMTFGLVPSSHRGQQCANGGHWKLRKVSENVGRFGLSSFPVVSLSGDLWSIAVGDTGNGVSVWQLSTRISSGQSVFGLVSASTVATGSRLIVLRRDMNGDLASIRSLCLRLRLWGHERADQEGCSVSLLVGFGRAPTSSYQAAAFGPFRCPTPGAGMMQVREWVDLAPVSEDPCKEESVYVMVVAEGKDRAQQGKWELTPFLVRHRPEDAGHGPAAGNATDDDVMDSLASASCFFAGSGQKSSFECSGNSSERMEAPERELSEPDLGDVTGRITFLLTRLIRQSSLGTITRRMCEDHIRASFQDGDAVCVEHNDFIKGAVRKLIEQRASLAHDGLKMDDGVPQGAVLDAPPVSGQHHHGELVMERLWGDAAARRVVSALMWRHHDLEVADDLACDQAVSVCGIERGGDVLGSDADGCLFLLSHHPPSDPDDMSPGAVSVSVEYADLTNLYGLLYRVCSIIVLSAFALYLTCLSVQVMAGQNVFAACEVRLAARWRVLHERTISPQRCLLAAERVQVSILCAPCVCAGACVRACACVCACARFCTGMKGTKGAMPANHGHLGIRRERLSHLCAMMNTHAYIGTTGFSVAAAASGAGPRAQGRAAGCAWALPGTRHQ